MMTSAPWSSRSTITWRNRALPPRMATCSAPTTWRSKPTSSPTRWPSTEKQYSVVGTRYSEGRRVSIELILKIGFVSGTTSQVAEKVLVHEDLYQATSLRRSDTFLLHDTVFAN